VRDAFRLALSPNAKQLYVTTGRFGGHQAVSVFSVEADGTLKLVQHLPNGADDFTEFEGGNETAVSPDGTLVMATASFSDRLFRFARNPETGVLTLIGSQQAGTFHQSGAAGVCFSPDGKFAYVADEAESAIQVYKIP
jgi:6-phosphogluconolactonase (cycloisomerase 2 family)